MSYPYTSFRNSGRFAGTGITEDNYSETSCGYHVSDKYEGRVHFPHDGTKPEELNGEVIIVQKGK